HVLASVHVFDCAADLASPTAKSPPFSYTTLFRSIDGLHSFTAKAADDAGNTTTTGAVAATVDTTPPSETISSTIGTNTGQTLTIQRGGHAKDHTLAHTRRATDRSDITSVDVLDGA